MQCVLKRCNIPLKEAQLAFIFESSTISKKYVTLLSKNSSCALLGQEHHLFEGTVSFTKNIMLHPQTLYITPEKEYCTSPRNTAHV